MQRKPKKSISLSEKQSPSGYLFTVTPPRGDKQTYLIDRFPIDIGRSQQCAIIVDDAAVSDKQVRIGLSERGLYAEELARQSQLSVNGVQTRRVILDVNADIRVGHTYIQIVPSRMGEEMPAETQASQFLYSEHTRPNPRQQSSHTSIVEVNTPRIWNAKVLECYQNIAVLTSLEEVSQGMLRHLQALLPRSIGGCVLVPDHHDQFGISGRWNVAGVDLSLVAGPRTVASLKERKGPVWLADATRPGATQRIGRLVFPLLRDDRLQGLIYLEVEELRDDFSAPLLGLVQSYLNLCAPIVETLTLTHRLDGWLGGVVNTLVATIGAKDTYTLGHSERVCRYAVAIGEVLNLTPEEKNNLMVSSLIHDIGKLTVSDKILKKSGLLSVEEYEQMKAHPLAGFNMVQHLPMAKEFIAGVRNHHERWDGTGYPDGLVGENIPLFGRIVAVADAFDAITSGRTYCGFMDPAEAVDSLCKSNDLFDPEILKAFGQAFDAHILSIRTGTMFGQVPVDEDGNLEDLLSS